MTKQERSLFFQSYFYSRRYFLTLFGLFFLLLLAVGLLFSSHWDLLIYIWCLFLFLTLPFLLKDMVENYKQFQRALWGREDAHMQTALERLLWQRLEESQEDLRQLDESERQKRTDMQDYFTLWAHQIKTPIAASRLLIDSLDQADKKKLLQGELFKIDAYANTVLQYLRLESFHEDLTLERVLVEDLVKETIKKFSIFFIQKGLSLNLHDLSQEVLTDKKWLGVVLEQLVSNSIKYTQTGGLEIWMEGACLYIKDTGLGIRSSDLERVFERGFSGYNGRLTQQSSGLGLYLSRQIVSKLQHQLTLESEPGLGTTAKIDLTRRDLVIE